MVVYLNGSFLDIHSAAISPDDRGFLFGDGAYEVIRSYTGKLFMAQAHLKRLARSLAELQIEYEDCRSLTVVFRQLLRENGLESGDATIYIQVTRGTAQRSHHFPTTPIPPTVYMKATAFTPPASSGTAGVRVRTAPDIRWARCDIKSVNLLPNVLGNQTAKQNNQYETLFIRDGMITEGTHTNVFAFIHGTLYTYPESNYILSGITREQVIRLARENGIQVHEYPLTLENFYRADEAFLTGTTTEVLPISQVDDQIIGTGLPGSNTVRLQHLLHELTQ